MRPLLAAALLASAVPAFADEPADAHAKPQAEVAAVEEQARRAAAVTLNYCRASLFRIRCCPTDAVLNEERRNILSNLNLAAIEDEEVLRLYTDVLDEIAAVRIADRDREVLGAAHARGVARHATVTTFGLLANAATADVAGAVRTGANSWWDLRAMQIDREQDLWRVDRDRVKGVLDKSGAFLDTSWKLARKRSIPDAWLVRDDDLRRLAAAERDPDPAARLRRLDRLGRYLAHHPPYWYAVARTQQRVGRFADAEETYLKLADLGGGHFRRDQMLAAGWANVAMIRDLNGDTRAADAAARALACSSDAWEVNLAAAGVLTKHARFAEAEDAVLRNLDGDLEVAQSGAALCVVLADASGTDPSAGRRLVERLRDPAAVAALPPAALVKCAAAVPGRLPAVAAERLRGSVSVSHDRHGVVLVADRGWELPSAVFRPHDDETAEPLRPLMARAEVGDGRQAVRFTDLGPDADGAVRLAVRFGDEAPLTLTFADPAPARETRELASRWGFPMPVRALTARREPAPRELPLARVDTAGRVVALTPGWDVPPAPADRLISESHRVRVSARPIAPAER